MERRSEPRQSDSRVSVLTIVCVYVCARTPMCKEGIAGQDSAFKELKT